MHCPRCKREHDILQYIRLESSPEFELETVPVYKCPSCKWIFAPAGEMDHQVYARMEKDLQEILKAVRQEVEVS